MIKVALLISNLEYGGAERQLLEIANNLSRPDFSVYVCTFSTHVPLIKYLDRGKSKFIAIRKYGRFDLSVIFRLFRFLRKNDIDVVHAFSFDTEIASRIAGRFAGTPLVVGSERNAGYSISAYKRTLLKATINARSMCIANSHAGARFNAQLYDKPLSDYRVVYNGVDTDLFKPVENKSLRKELGIAENSFCVGMFASFKAQKNHQMLFKAAALLLSRMPNLRFLVVGGELHRGMRDTNEYKLEMLQLLDDLKISSAFVFTGNCKNVHEYYSVCDVTVLPSNHEGTPNVVLESMACAVPVIATRVSDNEKLVPEGITGNIIELNDIQSLANAISEFVTHPELSSKFGADARRWVCDNFSTKQLAKNTGNMYLEGLANSPASY